MTTYAFCVELEEEDGIWGAVLPALPGCAVDAGSPEEALEAIHDDATAFVELLIEGGQPIPFDESAVGAMVP